jgi:hypothetical protein
MNWLRLQLLTARNYLKSIQYRAILRSNNKSLAENHFKFWSTLNHVNYEAFRVIENLMGQKPHKIVETGTSAWGTESTRFWDAYIRKYGGEFWSVDNRDEPRKRLRMQTSKRTHLVVDDSVNFLSSKEAQNATVLFLDSWDVDWANPQPAAIHGMKEFQAVAANLGPGTIMIVDDTPCELSYIPNQYVDTARDFLANEGVLPGKGAYIVQELSKANSASKIYHAYNIIYVLGENNGIPTGILQV